MSIAGIDPGLDGGIAIRCDNGSWVAYPMPLIGRELDVAEIADELKLLEVERVIVEVQQSMPKQGVASTFTIGTNYGKLLGALEARRIPYQLVRPRQWKDKILKGTKKDKNAAVAHTHRIAPDVELKPGRKRTPHDGVADAVCLVDYGQRIMRGEA